MLWAKVILLVLPLLGFGVVIGKRINNPVKTPGTEVAGNLVAAVVMYVLYYYAGLMDGLFK